MQRGKYVIPFSQLRMTDVESVGGKNASLGEMLSQLSGAGVRVPDGFATTAEAFRLFLEHGSLRDRIAKRLAQAQRRRRSSAHGSWTRRFAEWIVDAPFPAAFGRR